MDIKIVGEQHSIGAIDVYTFSILFLFLAQRFVNIQHFIDLKAKQLSYFVRGFWSYKIPYLEVDLYFWDTLEEWAHIKKTDIEPYSQKERVFWHVLHQLHFWPEQKLLQDPYLRSEMETCLSYLEGAGQYPLDCIGIRP